MKNEKSKWIAFFIALFLGAIGLHKFYLKENRAGWIYLVAFFIFYPIPALFAFIDAIILLFITEENFNKKYNS